MILKLLIITIIVSIVFLTGFPFEIDNIIAEKWKFHHLPEKPFLCVTCAGFWSMIAYLALFGGLNLTNVLVALILAYMAPTISNLIVLLKRCVDKIIEATMRYID